MVGTSAVLLENVQLKFNNFVKKPENFLKVQNDAASDLKSFVKTLYDLAKAAEDDDHGSAALPELVTDSLDEEQVWQQLELQNKVCDKLVQEVAFLVACRRRLQFPCPGSVGADGADADAAVQSDGSEGFGGAETQESAVKKVKKRKRKVTPTEVDDKFFKLDEMEEFLEWQERAIGPGDEADDGEELVDYFEDIPSDGGEDDDEDGDGLHYADFFDDPDSSGEGDDEPPERLLPDGGTRESQEKKVRFTQEDPGEGLEEGPESSLERRQRRLQVHVSRLEEEALAEKPWQLKGEVTSAVRPQNSLLEEVLEFDMVSRPAPVRTEKTTLRLEDIVKQRIKDKVWDDVERKVRPVETPSEYKKRLVLDQEKSKLSLAQVYEQEYLKQKETAGPPDTDVQEEEPKENKEIQKAMAKLFQKLDALCNFHYTPKLVIPEIKVISNLPAITVEEAAPVATSDATLLAPEEIKGKQKGELMGKAERDDTDKKRQRRWKKSAQRRRKKERESRQKLVEKLRPGLGNPYSKERALRAVEAAVTTGQVKKVEDVGADRSVRSSTAFFSSLQEEVRSQVRAKKHAGRRSDAPGGQEVSAKKLKL